MTLVLASHNKHKIAELSAMLKTIDRSLVLLSADEAGMPDDIAETGLTFEENALIKARAAAAGGYIGIADDSGLCVDALDGAPGVFSARFAGEPCCDRANNEKLLHELHGLPREKRGAKFVSVIACVFPDGRADVLARGECPGVILEAERGAGGFGYDPLFYYGPLDKTFAELSAEEKNAVSHRARAMQQFTVRLAQALGTRTEETT